jgi:hypothetical protein
MVGDETERVVARVHGETGTPMIYLDGSVSALENYPLFWRRVLQLFPSTEPRSAAPSVNLIGFGHRRTGGLDELRALLARAGVAVNLALLPSFTPASLPRFGAAWANVVCPSRMALEGFSQALELCRTPFIHPPAPCGWGGTLAWVDAVRGACGLPPLAAAEAAALSGDAAARWHQLRERAAHHRVAVVLHSGELRDPALRLNRGIAWLDVLEEMGFGVDLFVLAAAENERRSQTRLGWTPAWLQRPRHRAVWISSPDELLPALRRGDFSLIHSERFRDWRVRLAGKAPFAIADFELGFAGGCRTLARLLERCATPFFSRYRDYFRSPAAPA